MILFTSSHLLAAVRQSLQDIIAPELQTEFARVQVAAAMLALKEVITRLEKGDPCAVESDRLVGMMLTLAAQRRGQSAPVAQRLEAVVEEAQRIDDPRKRDRYLRNALYQLLGEFAGEDQSALLQLAEQNARATASEDSAWLCPESIASLT